MKKILIAVFLSVLSIISYSQPKIKCGLNFYSGPGGFQNLGEMQKYFDLQMLYDTKITEKKLNNLVGITSGLEGTINIGFQNRITLILGMAYQYSQNDITIFEKRYPNPIKDNSYTQTNSTATISTSSVVLPFLVQYSFSEKKVQPFINAGFSFQDRFRKKLSSTETIKKYNLSDNSYTFDYISFAGKDLQGLKTNTCNLIAGAGLKFSVFQNKLLTVGVNYSMNLTTSELWSSEINMGNPEPQNNEIFDAQKQNDIFFDTGIKINDWRESSLTLKIGMEF